MTSRTTTKDKVQIGLTPAATHHIARVMESGWFEDRQAAYRTAIAVALAHGLAAQDDEMANVTTAYNFVGGIDKDGRLRALIGALAPAEAARPAAYSERLAQAGLAYLSDRLSDDSASLSEILAPPDIAIGAGKSSSE
jgi:hypothetical protein